MKKEHKIAIASTEREAELRSHLLELFRSCPIPDNELLSNLGLFINRQTLSRILYMHFLYQKILDVNGIVAEFGVRWGQNISLFCSFRGIYEPFNYTRKIIGFDTFEGLRGTHEKDGKSEFVSSGSYGVSENYEQYLEQVLSYHEQESPVSHIKKYEIIKGDAVVELDKYLENNPETIFAFAFFDFDLYTPTLKCLEKIKGHLTKGSIIGFDDLGSHNFPGVTLALKEVFGLDKYQIKQVPWNPNSAYIIIGENK